MLELLSYTFVQRAFIAGSFIAVVSSVLGLFLVLRKMSLIGDGLSHASLGGIALGLFLGLYPFYIAVPFVVLASLLILKLSKKAKIYGDAAIAIVSSATISGGVIIASISGGFNVDLLSFLFGNILSISRNEVVFSLVLSLTTLLLLIYFYQDLFYSTFDSDQAKVAGVKVDRIDSVLVILSSLVVVLSVKVVGIMLASAFLVLPAVSALQVARSFRQTIILASIISIVSLVLGIIISLILNIPPGATIVFTSFIVFLICFVFKNIR